MEEKLAWAGHVASMVKMVNIQSFWSEYLKGRYHLGDEGMDGRIILRWIINSV
jgi:hypothetical protein